MFLWDYLNQIMPSHAEAWKSLETHLRERPIQHAEFLYSENSLRITLANGQRVLLPLGIASTGSGIQSVPITVPDFGSDKYTQPKDGISEIPQSIPRVKDNAVRK